MKLEGGWLVLMMVCLIKADWQVRQHLGTATPYWSQGSTDQSPAPPSCSIAHLDFISRHGSRNPTNGSLETLNNLAASVKNYSGFMNDNYPYIKTWSNPFITSRQGQLSFSGQEELFQMGARFNTTYFPLFSQIYDPDVYVMQSTQVSRTGISASSFAQGYLQGQGKIGSTDYQPPYIFSNTPAYDFLRFFKNCEQYTVARDNKSINDNEYVKYTNKNYPAIAAKVAQLLGVTDHWQISNSEVGSMLTACAFEIAVYNISDGWCALFSQEDILTFEYASDLSNYWIKSYGSGIGYKIGAKVLQEVVKTMDSIVSQQELTQKAYLRFAHAETIMPLSAVLGFYKDNYTLTADLTQEQINNRIWTTSKVSPFASNMAFVLYQCGNNEYRVKITLNEVEFTFPGCDEIYCPYDKFKSIYANALSFNFTAECAISNNNNNNNSDNINGSSDDDTGRTVSLLTFAVSIIATIFGCALVASVVFIFYIRKVGGHSYSQVDLSLQSP